MATAEATTISRFANAGIGFIVGEIMFLAVAHACGGPPWTIVAMVAFIALAFSGPWVSTLALLAPGLLWLALFQFTGNRELFFPYAMQLAAVVACRVGGGPGRRLAGGGVVIAAFLAIRVAQQATPLVSERVRRRVIRWFRLAGLLDAAAATDMLAWENSGFSIDAFRADHTHRPRRAELFSELGTPASILRPAAAESPPGRGPMASSSSRQLSSSTGSPISCCRRGSTGIATTGCLRRITS
jgi:hypothetical protein